MQKNWSFSQGIEIDDECKVAICLLLRPCEKGEDWLRFHKGFQSERGLVVILVNRQKVTDP